MSILFLLAAVLVGYVYFKLQKANDSKNSFVSNPNNKKRLTGAIVFVAAFSVFFFAGSDGKFDKRHIIRAITVVAIIALAALLTRWKNNPESAKTEQPIGRSLNPAYALGAVGFGAALGILWFIRIHVLQVQTGAQELSRVEARAILAALILSLTLAFIATVLVSRRLVRDIASKNKLTPSQSQVVTCALGSLLSLLLTFAAYSGFVVAALTLGLMALVGSFRAENKGMQNIQTYRIVSSFAIFMAVALNILIIVIRR